MTQQSPWDCPFCGRMSAEPPGLKRKATTHTITMEAQTYAVRCWYCGARGPLSRSVGQAIARWQHVAERKGAPKW